MRKVFMWNIILRKPEPTKYISEAYDVNGMQYKFWMTQLIKLNTEIDENITVITSLTKGDIALANYEDFKNEVLALTSEKNINVEFIPVFQEVDLDGITFTRFFKEVAGLIKDNDRLYVDITFGIKPYTMSMLTALVYVTKVARNVVVETITYIEKYNGMRDHYMVDEATIYNLTSLFYMISIAGSLNEGERVAADKMIDLLLR
jgi:hypothetical protein